MLSEGIATECAHPLGRQNAHRGVQSLLMISFYVSGSSSEARLGQVNYIPVANLNGHQYGGFKEPRGAEG